MVIECKYEDLVKNMNNICEYVTDNCEYSYFNFFSLHYCYLNQDLWLTIPIIVIIGLLCFFLLSDTSNRYLANPLTILSDKLKISQNLAGLTFVAFGNGAPDVISSIVASKDDSDGVEMTLGALMGASVFVTSFVLSTVLIFARSVKVEKSLFIRDIVMFLFTLSILCTFSFDNKITLWESILFLSLYFVYLGVAVLQDKCSPQTNEYKITDDIISKDEIIAHEIAQDIEESDRKDSKSVKKDEENAGNDNNQIKKSEIKTKELKSNPPKLGNLDYKINSSSFPNHEISMESLLKDNHFYCEKESEQLELRRIENISSPFFNFRYRIKKHYFQHIDTNWDKKNFLYKIFYIIFEFPFSVLRDVTIPAVELSKWNKNFVILMPITIFILVTWKTNNYSIFLDNIYILIPTIFSLLVICLLISRSVYNHKLPNSIKILCIISFSMSGFWIWCISELLVDVLKVVGVLIDIPEAFLGMTVLAFGNSVPDLSVNCSLAKNGYGEMAIAGSIAGPLFNILVGLGISLVRKNIVRGDIPFSFFGFDKDIIILISFSALFLNLFLLLIQASISKFRLKLSVSYVGYFVYLAFCIGILFVTFR